MTESQNLAVGHVLSNDFRIDSVLSETEFATTYQGTQLGKGVPVLIRVFDVAAHLPEASLPMVRRRFVNEARQLGDIAHPSLESVLAAGEEGGRLFLITGYLEGVHRLDEILARHRPGLAAGLRLLIQVLDGLHEAHQLGHPHRDLSPARLRVMDDGTVKVTDFALVKLLHTLRGTREGASFVHAYMSPEQARGEEVGPKSDLYAVGAVAFALATGHPPFPGEGDTLRAAILKDPLPPRHDALPAPLWEFLRKALDKDPDSRYADARQMAAAARRVLEAPAEVGAAAPIPEIPGASPTDDDALWAALASPEVPSATPAKAADGAAEAAPAKATPMLPPTTLPTAPPRPGDTPPWLAEAEDLDAGGVVIRRRGPSPAITFSVMAVAAIVVGFFAMRLMGPGSDPGNGPPVPLGTEPASGTPTSGLVHDLSTPDAPPPVDVNPLEGVDIQKLTPAEKEVLLEKLVAEVRRQIGLKHAEGARRAMDRLSGAAPDDPRFYELDSQVLALAIQRPPVPHEGEEVPLITVDEPPRLEKHTAPRFPKRPPEDSREVIVKAFVDEEGRVAEALVLEDDEFGSGAIAAETVRGWVFTPALTKGVRVKVWIAIPIRTGGAWKKPEIALVQP